MLLMKNYTGLQIWGMVFTQQQQQQQNTEKNPHKNNQYLHM